MSQSVLDSLSFNTTSSHNNNTIDVFFGKLTKNTSSKRIRKKSNASLATFFPNKDQEGLTHQKNTDNDHEKEKKKIPEEEQKSSHSSLHEQNNNSNNNSRILGFFSSFSTNTNTTKEKIENQNDPSTSKKKQRKSIDPDADLQKFQESAFYNSLHIEKLKSTLHQETINTVAEEAPLRKELWHGVVEQPLLRAESWRLALGISPATSSRRHRDAQRQILEYRDYLKLYYYCNMSNNTSNESSLSTDSSTSTSSHQCMFPSVTDTPVPPPEKRTKTERDILYQLSIDLPRHKAALYFLPQLTERLRRCLFIWALRNPAVGYVQGMDDVVVVLFMAFLDEAFSLIEPWKKKLEEERKRKLKEQQELITLQQQQSKASSLEQLVTPTTAVTTSFFTEPELMKLWIQLRLDLKGESTPNNHLVCGTRPWTEDLEDLTEMINLLPVCALDLAECDTYNCGGRFLSWGMDRYTFGQPGVLACVDQIGAGVKMFDPELHTHIRDVCGLEFRTFAYKYVHLLLVRDLGQWLSMRLFDTMMSAGASGCWELFSYFCVAWLISIREKILNEIPIDEALFFLQEPSKLGVGGINGHKEGKSALRWMEELLSRAYLLMLQKRSNTIIKITSNGMKHNGKK